MHSSDICIVDTCEVELRWGRLDGEHPGVVELPVAEEHLSHALNVAVGALHDEQVQQEALAVLVHLWVLMVKP